MMKTLQQFIKPLYEFKKLALAVMATSIILVFIEGVSIGVILPLLQSLQSSSQDPLPMPYGLNWLQFSSRLQQVNIYCTLIIGLILFKSLVRTANTYINSRLEFGILASLREKFVKTCCYANFSKISAKDPGKLLTLHASHAYNYSSALDGILAFFTVLGIACVYVAFLLYISWKMTLIAAAFGSLTIALTVTGNRWLNKLSARLLIMEEKIYSLLWDDISHLKLVRSYGIAKRRLDSHKRSNADLTGIVCKMQTLQEGIRAGNEILYVVLLFGGIFFALNFYGQNIDVWVPSFIAFAVILFRLSGKVNQITLCLAGIATSWAPSKQFLAFIEKTEHAIEKPVKRSLDEVTKVEFCGVDIGIKSNTSLLHNISFAVKRGEIIGITGPTGVGKTTLLENLIGLLQPSLGKISLNDISLSAIDHNLIAEKIAIVFQEPHIFSDNVLWNITLGQNYSSQEVNAAAKSAAIYEEIGEMPEGYKTIIGEGGLRLSSGEKQRLALARALIRKPQVLIIDEGTCALDVVTEEKILEALRGSANERITILVSHRISTLKICQRVLVF